jgi:YD repeat-containing protein
MTDELGRVTRYYYDGNGPGVAPIPLQKAELTLVTKAQSSNERNLYKYAYDELQYVSSTSKLKGLLTTESIFYDQSNTYDTHYSYDQHGLLTRKQQQVDKDGVEHSITILSHSPLTGLLQWVENSGANLSSPDGVLANVQRRNYSYDNAGRLTCISDDYGSPFAPERILTMYEYDGNGNKVKEMHRAKRLEPNYQVTQYQYDELNRLIRVTDPKGSVVEYVYDETNNRVEEIHEDRS